MFYDKPILDSKGEEIKLGDRVYSYGVIGTVTGVRFLKHLLKAQIEVDGNIYVKDSELTVSNIGPDRLKELEDALKVPLDDDPYHRRNSVSKALYGKPVDDTLETDWTEDVECTIAITKRGVLERLKSYCNNHNESPPCCNCLHDDEAGCPFYDYPGSWDIDKILEAIDHE